MEAFFVVVVAVSVLAVGVLALVGLRRMNATMQPTEQSAGPQES
jgi:Tfp pilus assembly protein PilV